MNVREYLKNKGLTWSEVSRPSGLQAIMRCPKCGDEKSFAVSIDTGAYQCFRKNNCGVSGSWYQFQKMMGDNPLPIDNDSMFIGHRREKNYTLPQVHSDKPNEKLYKYFADRKIPEAIVKQFRIGIKNDAIMFPHFECGKNVFVKYRSMIEKKFWNENGCKPILYNMDACENEPVLRIVEGHFDAMAAKVYDFNAVSVPNGVSDLSWIETCWDYIDKFNHIHLFFDNDEAGQSAIKNIVTRLGMWRCYNVILPAKDLNECLMNDIPAETIHHAEFNATEFNHYILKRARDFREDVKSLNKQIEKRRGIETSYNKLTDILKGWREEEVTIIQGRNGSGKSTWVSQEVLELTKRCNRVCMASLELPPKRYLNWMAMQCCGKTELDDNDIDLAFDVFGKHLFIVNKIGEISKEELFDVFKFAAKKYGVKFFVIDSLMRLRFDPRFELTEQKNFLSECCDFVKEFECHLFLVAHPRKGNGNERPDKDDVSGSGNITNLADNVLAIWKPDDEYKAKCARDGKDMSDMYLYVQKNREWGKLDTVEFRFVDESKTFISLL